MARQFPAAATGSTQGDRSGEDLDNRFTRSPPVACRIASPA